MAENTKTSDEGTSSEERIGHSDPIPICSRSRFGGDINSTYSPLSQSYPASNHKSFIVGSVPPPAPVIGSLPAPHLEHSPLPPLSLPPPTPETGLILGSAPLRKGSSVFKFEIPKRQTLSPSDIPNISTFRAIEREPMNHDVLSTSLTALSVLQGSLGPLDEKACYPVAKEEELEGLSRKMTLGFSDEEVMAGDDHDEDANAGLFHFEDH